MATYYVRPGGSDSNTGTGPATNQAWATIQKALGSSSGLAGGDIVYVAPGHYLEQVTIGITSPSSTVQIIGDVTASQFSGLSAGIVRLSGFLSAGNTAITYANSILKGTSKNNLSFSNFIFEGKGSGASAGNALVSFLTSQNVSFSKCLFSQQGYGPGPVTASCLEMTAPVGQALNATISKCVFEAAVIPLYLLGRSVADTSSVKDCIFIGGQYNIITESLQCVIQNCTFNGASNQALFLATGSATFKSQIRNNLFLYCLTAMNSSSTTHQDEDYNRIIGASTARTNVTAGANSSVVGSSRLTYGYTRMIGLSATDFWSPEQNSPNQGFGTATGAEATDVYSTAWTGATPDTGYQTYSVSSTLTATYQPTERNASTITIAPGSTSQSIELYLGATGLAFNTSGLQAYYIRNRSAPVAITLVTQTATGAWTSGGFAEISSSLTPGVYRLDVPDAAFAAGASDVTIVVRGASGTNGAVVTVTLSAGGLTAAQTADAVLDAVASTHNNIGSIGAFIQDKTGYSLSTSQTFNTTGSVGSVTGNVTGNVTGTVGGVVGNIVGNLTGSVGTVATPDNIIDGVWDEQRVGHTASGSFGEKLQTNAMADEMLARDLGSGQNSGAAEERTVRSALRALRNKVNVGSSQMVVKKEDDTTDAWTASVTTTAVSSNVSGIDPN